MADSLQKWAGVPPERVPKPGLNIYRCLAVNPYKLTIAAEELGIAYNYINLDIAAGETRADWYVSHMNPNGRIPAIVHVKEDGTSVTVFESAACLLYLVNEFDKEHKLSYPIGTPEYWSQLSWLSWQVAGLGPMMGQSAHFNRYATEPVLYASTRFLSECGRLHHVLEKRLSTSEYIAGDRLTVADVAIFIFTHSAQWCGIDINKYPHEKAWHDKLEKRPGFQRALQVPVRYPFSDEKVSNSDPEAVEKYSMMRKYGGPAIEVALEQWAGDILPVPSDYANHKVNE
ncbi:glutathione S-transferase [Astrocystis sublimbata]|nr:glutathione S-transferase [Astrocystis sublimbata]